MISANLSDPKTWWMKLLRPQDIPNCATMRGKEFRHICFTEMCLCLLQLKLGKVSPLNYCSPVIPANFFWDIGVKYFYPGSAGIFEDDTIISEDFQRRPKSSEEVWSLPKTSEVFRRRIKASSLPVLFTSKIRDREEGIVICSFYTWFSFLTWVWVDIFLEIVPSKTATTHIFQSGVRNWPESVR